ncbi:hypothetical protein LIS77_19060 [Cytobacillus firmus]|uniref:hypothetical protein n=1 Tax=Cytobacillus firmus TaxID=1399 RepID=UPI00207B0708|nr:hypothetical protein [Cytobacillus firmus]USK37998.1 hypothetical protein LIS77_19060 [Cytobacillus firmus]
MEPYKIELPDCIRHSYFERAGEIGYDEIGVLSSERLQTLIVLKDGELVEGSRNIFAGQYE